jgi:hypothetical protein
MTDMPKPEKGSRDLGMLEFSFLLPRHRSMDGQSTPNAAHGLYTQCCRRKQGWVCEIANVKQTLRRHPGSTWNAALASWTGCRLRRYCEASSGQARWQVGRWAGGTQAQPFGGAAERETNCSHSTWPERRGRKAGGRLLLRAVMTRVAPTKTKIIIIMTRLRALPWICSLLA